MRFDARDNLGAVSLHGSGLASRDPVNSGGRTILSDAGTVLRGAGIDEILHFGGPHPFDDYFVKLQRLGLAADLRRHVLTLLAAGRKRHVDQLDPHVDRCRPHSDANRCAVNPCAPDRGGRSRETGFREELCNVIHSRSDRARAGG